MVQIDNKSNCCGCGACYNICPVSAIKMKSDNEGFLYPDVDTELCVNCGKCDSVCPILNKATHEENTKGFIIRNKNAEIVEQSTSGGAFTLFAESLLSKDYVVYGAGYDENMQVICKKATTSQELAEMRGSKFVQSNIGKCYSKIRTELNRGGKVLFTGTPCQVEGLVCFLGRKPENLFCIDFVCRGVPSPGLWKNYVEMMESKYDSKIINVRFKHKTYGYHATTMKVDFENGKTWYGSGRIDPMMKAFVSELASRPSCHECAFKGAKRVSDITMFDCYGFSEITGDKDDEKGWSSLLIHIKAGMELLGQVDNDMIYYTAPVDKIISINGIMVNNSAKANENRQEFYSLVENMPIDKAMHLIYPIRKSDYMIEALKGFIYRTGLIRIVKRMKKEGIQINASERHGE